MLVLQCIYLKWSLAFLVGLLTGVRLVQPGAPALQGRVQDAAPETA